MWIMVRNKAVSYAVMAMVDIAERSGSGEKTVEVQAADLANRLGFPTAYTAKVLSSLARASLLRSDRGPRGGFQLARSPQEITLFDILQAVGAWNAGDIALAPSAPPKLRRSLNEALTKAMSHAREVLEEVRLADLLETPAHTPEPVGV